VAAAQSTINAPNALKLLPARLPALSPPRIRIASVVPATRPAIAPAGANTNSASKPDPTGSARLPKPTSSSTSSVPTKPLTAPTTPPAICSEFFT